MTAVNQNMVSTVHGKPTNMNNSSHYLQNMDMHGVPGLQLPGEEDDDSESDSSEGRTEVEIEITTPRLNTDVFDELRRKYPAAFRRRTSASSICSDVSSVYSGSMIIGEVRQKRRGRLRTQTEGPRAGGLHREGLPPKPPPKGSEMRNGSLSDRDKPRSILKKDNFGPTDRENWAQDREFKSHDNGYKWNMENGANGGVEMSVKERLRRNREELKELLKSSNMPFRKHKNEIVDSEYGRSDNDSRVLDRTMDRQQPQQIEGTSVLSTNYVAKESVNTLQELQNQITCMSPRLVHAVQRSPRTATKDGRSLLDHLKSGKTVKSRRFESPDSAHDSAVDMDSASTQSSTNPSVENYYHQRQKQKAGLNLSNISEDTRGSLEVDRIMSGHVASEANSSSVGMLSPRSDLMDGEEVVEPIRNSRAPKLKTARRRGQSPSPSITTSQGTSPRTVVEAVPGTGGSALVPAGLLTIQNVARSQQQMAGSGGRPGVSKDSDGDSGIVGRLREGSLSSGDHDNVADDRSVLSALGAQLEAGRPGRSRARPVEQTAGPSARPLRADHAVLSPRSDRGMLSPRSYQGELTVETASSVADPSVGKPPPRASKLRSRSQPRDATHIAALPPPPHPYSNRSASSDRSSKFTSKGGRRVGDPRVTFEDEVYNGLDARHRTYGSQPVLNTVQSTDAGVYNSRESTGDRGYHKQRRDSDVRSDAGYHSVRNVDRQDLRGRGNIKTIHNRFHSDQDLYGANRRKQEDFVDNGSVGGRCPRKEKRSPRKESQSTQNVFEEAVDERTPSRGEKLPVHRASPVVVLPPKPVKPPRKGGKAKMVTQESTESLLSSIPPPMTDRSGSSGPDVDIQSEVSFGGSIHSCIDDVNFEAQRKQKKSKLPWKKNKGRYTPNEELERMKLNILQSNSRAGSWSSLCSEQTMNPMGSALSLNSVSSKKSGHKKKSKHKGNTMEHHIPKTYTPEPIEAPQKVESPYESIDHYQDSIPVDTEVPRQVPSKTSPRPSASRQSSNPYEEVDVVRESRGKSPRNRRSGYEAVDISPRRSLKSPQSSQDLTSSSLRNSTLRRSFDFENPYEEVRVGDEVVMSRERDVVMDGDIVTDEDLPESHHVYAVVDLSKKTSPQHQPRRASETPPGSLSDSSDVAGPDLPDRGYQSNLQSSKHLSDSKTSLSEKMGSFRDSARRKLSQLRRAISLERVNSPDSEDVPDGKLTKSPSLKSLTDKLPSFRRANKKEQGPSGKASSKPPGLPKGGKKVIEQVDTVEQPKHFRPIGKVKYGDGQRSEVTSLHGDGTQTVELHRPQQGVFGFYIAKGNAKYKHGIFISRLSDGLPAHFYAGLISLGDEILEINGVSLRGLSLEDVYGLMAGCTILTLRTLPYIARGNENAGKK